MFRCAYQFTAFLVAALTIAAGAARAQAEQEMQPRGVVVAVSSAAFSSDLSAAAKSIKFREGEAFKKGTTLVVFDCRREQAALSAARAAEREAELNLQSNRYLQARKAIGRHDVDVALARLQKARAETSALAAKVDQCTVIAPFSGEVVALSLRQFERPEPNKPFLEIVSNAQLEIEAIVPSTWLHWLKTGAAFRFRVDELKADLAGRVVRIGATVDAVSQTVKIYGVLTKPSEALRAGMSGTVHVERPAG